MYHPKELGTQNQTKPKVNRRKEITKIREEINKFETKRKEKENTNETKIWLFEMIKKLVNL